MNTYKVVINYTNLYNAQLGVLAKTAHENFTANATTFPSPPQAMVDFLDQITDFESKLVQRQSRAIQDVAAMKVARLAMLQALRQLANYANSVAEGQLEIVMLTGMPFYSTQRNSYPSPPAAPTNLRLRRGNGPGSLVLRFTPPPGRVSNEVEVNLNDPNVSSEWQSRGIFQTSVVPLDGFASGIVVRVRVRSIGPDARQGLWSSEADIRTL